jgi:hypothetical protein
MFCIKPILTCERAKNMGLFTQGWLKNEGKSFGKKRPRSLLSKKGCKNKEQRAQIFALENVRHLGQEMRVLTHPVVSLIGGCTCKLNEKGEGGGVEWGCPVWQIF